MKKYLFINIVPLLLCLGAETPSLGQQVKTIEIFHQGDTGVFELHERIYTREEFDRNGRKVVNFKVTTCAACGQKMDTLKEKYIYNVDGLPSEYVHEYLKSISVLKYYYRPDKRLSGLEMSYGEVSYSYAPNGNMEWVEKFKSGFTRYFYLDTLPYFSVSGRLKAGQKVPSRGRVYNPNDQLITECEMYEGDTLVIEFTQYGPHGLVEKKSWLYPDMDTYRKIVGFSGFRNTGLDSIRYLRDGQGRLLREERYGSESVLREYYVYDGRLLIKKTSQREDFAGKKVLEIYANEEYIYYPDDRLKERVVYRETEESTYSDYKDGKLLGRKDYIERKKTVYSYKYTFW
jgi:hypothetical protein